MMWKNGYDRHALHQYVRSKFQFGYVLFRKGPDQTRDARFITGLSREEMLRKYHEFWTEGFQWAEFRKNARVVEEIAKTARRHDADLLLGVPNMAFNFAPKEIHRDPWPRLVSSLVDHYGVRYRDFRGTMRKTAYFSDSVHLNTRGMQIFLREHLRPFLDAGLPSDESGHGPSPL